MDKAPSVTVQIGTKTVIVTILLLLLLLGLYILRDLVLVVLTAVVIASAVEPAVRWFIRYRVPRVASVLLVYILTISFFAGVFYFFLPLLIDDASAFLAGLPQYLSLIQVPAPVTEGLFGSAGGQSVSLSQIVAEWQGTFSNASEGLLRMISTVFGGVLSFMLIIVLSFYFAVQETGIDDFLKIITPVKHHAYVNGLWRRSQEKIGKWMQGQLILSVIAGVLVYLGLTILGVKYAFFLAVIAALFELVPVFGSIMAAIPGIAVAFVDGGTTLALLTLGLYIIVNQFQGNLIYPLVVTKVVGVPPLLVILALIVGAQLAGFLGVLLSVPVAAAIQEFVADLQRGKVRDALERGVA